MSVAVDGFDRKATPLRGTLVAGKSPCAILVSDAGKFLSKLPGGLAGHIDDSR